MFYNAYFLLRNFSLCLGINFQIQIMRVCINRALCVLVGLADELSEISGCRLVCTYLGIGSPVCAVLHGC